MATMIQFGVERDEELTLRRLRSYVRFAWSQRWALTIVQCLLHCPIHIPGSNQDGWPGDFASGSKLVTVILSSAQRVGT